MDSYAGCQNPFIVKHLAHFLPILKALGDKLVPHLKSVLKVGKKKCGLGTVFFSCRVNVMDLQVCIYFYKKLLILLFIEIILRFNNTN